MNFDKSPKKILTYASKAFLLTVIVSLLGIFLMSFLLYKGALSLEALKVGIKVLYFIACFVGGIIMGRGMEKKRFIWGGLYGVSFCFILAVISIIFAGGKISDIKMTTMLICIFAGMSGGMVS